MGSLLGFSQRGNQNFSQIGSIWRLWEESISRLVQIVGRSQFLEAVGLKAFFPCLLSVRRCSWLWDSISIPYVIPSIFQPVMVHQVLFMIEISLTSYSGARPRNLSVFKGLTSLDLAHSDNLPILRKLGQLIYNFNYICKIPLPGNMYSHGRDVALCHRGENYKEQGLLRVILRSLTTTSLLEFRLGIVRHLY